MQMRYALLCLLLPVSAIAADEVVFYRCTDAAGALTLQNMACPKGSKQEKKLMQAVSTIPMGNASAPPAAPTAASSAEAAPLPRSADGTRLPPPNLFQCTTHDKDSYITENEEPQSRCVAMRTVGLDGNPDTGAGEACEVKRDQCARVPDVNLCESWKKRLGETEVAWRFARPANAAANKAEYERVQRILQETSCAG